MDNYTPNSAPYYQSSEYHQLGYHVHKTVATGPDALFLADPNNNFIWFVFAGITFIITLILVYSYRTKPEDLKETKKDKVRKKTVNTDTVKKTQRSSSNAKRYKNKQRQTKNESKEENVIQISKDGVKIISDEKYNK